MVSKGKKTIEVSPELRERIKIAKGVDRTNEEFIELLVTMYERLDRAVSLGVSYAK